MHAHVCEHVHAERRMAEESVSSGEDEFFDYVDWEEKLSVCNCTIRGLRQHIEEMEEKILELKRQLKGKSDIQKQIIDLKELLKKKEKEIIDLKAMIRKKEETVSSLKRSDSFLRDGYASMKRRVNWVSEPFVQTMFNANEYQILSKKH